MSSFEKFKEQLPNKETFYSLLMFGTNLKLKRQKMITIYI